MSNGDQLFRKSHIKRIYKDDDPESGQWVDIERLDELRFVSHRQFPWREKRYVFDWDSFDPDGDNVTKKKIKQHKDDPDDAAIEVPVRDMVFVTEGREQQYQGYRHYFINDGSNSTRESHSRRVYHHDIPDDALDDNKDPPRDPSDYINAASPDKDKDQFVEVEMLDKYWTNERETRDAHGNLTAGTSGIWQEKKWLIDSTTDRLLFDESGNDPDFAPTFNPDAGPQVDPPWRLDPLQNIVNVNWGTGAVFVFFGYKEPTDGDPNVTVGSGYIHYVKFSSKNSDPDIRKISMPRGFEIQGGGFVSYFNVKQQNGNGGQKGTATFVACGYEVVLTTGLEVHAMIYLSNDGHDWQNVFERAPEGVPGEIGDAGHSPMGIVWSPDDKSFYCDMTYINLYDDGIHYFDRIFSSSDGTSWSQISGVETTDYARGTAPDYDTAHPNDYRSPFNDYTANNDCIDLIGNNVPDGVMRYDDKRKVTMKPMKPPTNRYADRQLFAAVDTDGNPYGSSEVSVKIESADQDAEEFTTSIPGIAIVTCVGGANGIWMAAGFIGFGVPAAYEGGGRVAVSTDDGKTWKTVMDTPQPILTLAAAPAGDIAKN